MAAVHRFGCRVAIWDKKQFPVSVNRGKAPQCLGQIVQEITPGFDVVFLVDTKEFCSIGEGFNLLLGLCQLHMAGFRQNGEKIIGKRTG